MYKNIFVDIRSNDSSLHPNNLGLNRFSFVPNKLLKAIIYMVWLFIHFLGVRSFCTAPEYELFKAKPSFE